MQELGHGNISSSRTHIFLKVMPRQFFPRRTPQMNAVGCPKPPSHVVEPRTKRNVFEIEYEQLASLAAPTRIVWGKIVVNQTFRQADDRVCQAPRKVLESAKAIGTLRTEPLQVISENTLARFLPGVVKGSSPPISCVPPKV